MIARIVSIHVPEGKADETQKIWKNQWGPLIVQQPGCLSHLFMRHHDDPKRFISLSLWAHRHAIDQFVASPAREEIRQNTRVAMEAVNVVTEIYDVVH